MSYAATTTTVPPHTTCGHEHATALEAFRCGEVVFEGERVYLVTLPGPPPQSLAAPQ